MNFEISLTDDAKANLYELEAYRIFWHYGSKNKQITVVMITKHP